MAVGEVQGAEEAVRVTIFGQVLPGGSLPLVIQLSRAAGVEETFPHTLPPRVRPGPPAEAIPIRPEEERRAGLAGHSRVLQPGATGECRSRPIKRAHSRAQSRS